MKYFTKSGSSPTIWRFMNFANCAGRHGLEQFIHKINQRYGFLTIIVLNLMPTVVQPDPLTHSAKLVRLKDFWTKSFRAFGQRLDTNCEIVISMTSSTSYFKHSNVRSDKIQKYNSITGFESYNAHMEWITIMGMLVSTMPINGKKVVLDTFY